MMTLKVKKSQLVQWAPAASDAPTAGPGPGYLPPPVIGRALDVLNAPGSTREEFQAVFNSRNLGPGDIEDLSPELWEELRLDSAEAEYDLLGSQVLDRPPGLSEAAGPSTTRRDTPIEEIPRTSSAGLEATNPELHQEFMNELRMLRDQDPNEESNSELFSESETSWPSEDPPGSQGPGDAALGASSMPRTAQGKRPPPQPPTILVVPKLWL